jgi:hypothetical protein
VPELSSTLKLGWLGCAPCRQLRFAHHATGNHGLRSATREPSPGLIRSLIEGLELAPAEAKRVTDQALANDASASGRDDMTGALNGKLVIGACVLRRQIETVAEIGKVPLNTLTVRLNQFFADHGKQFVSRGTVHLHGQHYQLVCAAPAVRKPGTGLTHTPRPAEVCL